MKKKLSVLAALVLTVVLSTGSVAGTYAKYITKGNDITDEVRVAKWGMKPVVVDLFDPNEATYYNYSTDLTTNTVNNSVASEELVFAPGVRAIHNFTLTDSNKPETNYIVKIVVDNVLIDIISANGNDFVDIFVNTGSEVKKIDYNLVGTGQESIEEQLGKFLNLAINNGSTTPIVYAAGTSLTEAFDGKTFSFGVQWPFEISDAQDETDTEYGNGDAEGLKVTFHVEVVQSNKPATA